MRLNASACGIVLVALVPLVLASAPHVAAPVHEKTSLDDRDTYLAVWHFKAQYAPALWARAVQRHGDLYILAVGWEYGNSSLVDWTRGADGYWRQSTHPEEPLEGCPECEALLRFKARIDWPDELNPLPPATIDPEQTRARLEAERVHFLGTGSFGADGRWLVESNVDHDALWAEQKKKIWGLPETFSGLWKCGTQ